MEDSVTPTEGGRVVACLMIDEISAANHRTKLKHLDLRFHILLVIESL